MGFEILLETANSKRRRFQPPITTYFSPATLEFNDPDHLSNHHYPATTYCPAIPEKTQASLLHVGMRVRKAVAEGYKTTAKLEEQRKNMKPPTSSSSSHADRKRSYTTYQHTELTPFCGLSKTGDIAVQTVPSPPCDASAPRTSLPERNSGTHGPVVTDDGDAFSLPASSQESTSSASAWFPLSASQKRSLGEDSEEEENDPESLPDDLFRRATSGGGSRSLSAFSAFGLESLSPLVNGRSILVPKLGRQQRRRRRHKGGALTGYEDGEEESSGLGDFSSLSVAASMDNDGFEDAAFLRAREEVDADVVRNEIRMGDA